MSIEGLYFRNYKKINQSTFKDQALCQLKDWNKKSINQLINQSFKKWAKKLQENHLINKFLRIGL